MSIETILMDLRRENHEDHARIESSIVKVCTDVAVLKQRANGLEKFERDHKAQHSDCAEDSEQESEAKKERHWGATIAIGVAIIEGLIAVVVALAN